MGDKYLSAGIIPADARATHVQNPTLAKRSRSEYEYDDHLLTGIRHGQHVHRSSGTSGYVNRRSSEDLRLRERGSDGVGVRSLRETTRGRAGHLAAYNYDDQRRGLLIPISDRDDQRRGLLIPPSDRDDQRRGLLIPPSDRDDQRRGLLIPPSDHDDQRRGLLIPPSDHDEQRRGLLTGRYGQHDHLLTGRYSQHDHALSGTSGYVNHRCCEDLRVGERGNRGVGLRSLTETTRDHAGDLAPYNNDDQRRGLLIPPSDHVLPADASSTLFVEGVPSDCSCREAAHIFRHFRGFREVRLVNKSMEHRNQSQRGAGAEASVNVVVLCFVEFDNPKSAATAMDALQGYRLDQSDRDSPSLKLQFARPPRNTKRNGSSFARDLGRWSS